MLFAALVAASLASSPVAVASTEENVSLEGRSFGATSARLGAELGLGLASGAVGALTLGGVGLLSCPSQVGVSCGPSALAGGIIGLLVGSALGVGWGASLFGEDRAFFRPLLGALVGGLVGGAAYLVSGKPQAAALGLSLPVAGAMVSFEVTRPERAISLGSSATPVAGFAFRFQAV